MAFIEAIGSGYINYFNFKTRSSRSEYWWFILFGLLAGITIAIFEIIIGTYNFESGMGPIGGILVLVNVIPSIALAARRLHDVGRSGWWQLLYFTIIGTFVILYWLIKKGDGADNHFGKCPLGSTTQLYPNENLEPTAPTNAPITRVTDASAQRLNEVKPLIIWLWCMLITSFHIGWIEISLITVDPGIFFEWVGASLPVFIFGGLIAKVSSFFCKIKFQNLWLSGIFFCAFIILIGTIRTSLAI